MEEARVNLFELTGSSYEIGYQLGKKMLANPRQQYYISLQDAA